MDDKNLEFISHNFTVYANRIAAFWGTFLLLLFSIGVLIGLIVGNEKLHISEVLMWSSLVLAFVFFLNYTLKICSIKSDGQSFYRGKRQIYPLSGHFLITFRWGRAYRIRYLNDKGKKRTLITFFRIRKKTEAIELLERYYKLNQGL